MNKRILFFMYISLIFIFLNSAPTEGANTYVELSTLADSSLLKPGDSFVVNITLKDITNLVGGEIIVNYDPNILSLTSKNLSLANAFDFTNISGVVNTNLEDSPGKAIIIFGTSKNSLPLSGDYLIGSLNFNVTTKGTGAVYLDNNSKLIYEDSNGNLGEMPFNSNSLNYNIVGIGSISGIVKDNTGKVVDNLNIEIIKESETVYSTTTLSDGSFSIESIVEGSYTLHINSSNYEEYSTNISIENGVNTEVNIILIELVQGDVTGDKNYQAKKDTVLTYYLKKKDNKISFDGILKLFIPQNALTQDTKLTIKEIPSKDSFVNIYDIQVNAPLKDKIEISFKIPENALNKNIGIYYYNEEKEKWIYIGGEKYGNHITAWVKHFSKFAVFENKNYKEYTDTRGNWAKEYINRLTIMGIIDGVGKGNFEPNGYLTRAEMAKILNLALDLKGTDLNSNFSDSEKVPKWALEHINTLVDMKIMIGYSDNTFRPDEYVTRAQLAVMLDRALGEFSIEDDEILFSDNNQIPHWARESVYKVRALGIIEGYNDGTFKPDKPVTRAEICKVIVKMLEVINII